MLKSLTGDLSGKSENFPSCRRLALHPLLPFSTKPFPRLTLARGLPKCRINKMQFSQFFAGEESGTEQLHKKNTVPARYKKYKAEPSMGAPERKRSGQNQKKVMEGKTLGSSGG